jgi:hypothetical protein
MKRSIIGTRIVMAAGFAAAGCAVEDGSDVGPVGEAAQEVSSFGIWSWGCASAPCSLDLGTATNRTCFLAGVWGNLQHAGTYSQVDVVRAPNITGQLRWGLQVVANSQPLGGTAVCIPGAVAATGTWANGAAEVNLGAGNASRRCFLSSVRNTNGFTAASDFVRVRKVGTSWFVGGNQQPGRGVVASAVCVDVPSATGDFGLVAGEGSSFLDRPVVDNNPSGWACGLRLIGGHFTANNYGDGVWLGYNNGISQWQASAVNGKSLTAYCVK